MMKKEKFIDPWGSELPEDYARLIKEFGLEEFNLADFPNPNKLMRRGLVFAGRGLKEISKAIKEKKPFYALSGIMPSSEKIHLGNKCVIDNMAYFQQQGAKTYMLVADLEAAATRGIDIKEARKRALNYYIPAYISLGLDPKKTKFYFQSTNKDVVGLAYSLSGKATINEYRAIYGSTSPSRIISSVLQVADILYPQLKEEMPGVVPVGIDQDPHIRLTRDIAKRAKKFKFFLPSGIYHKYTPALDGSLKMSKSKGNFIEIPESSDSVRNKIMKAVTGGRKTAEEQKKLGGQPEKDMIYELFKQHLIENDEEFLQRIKDNKSGKILSKEDKEYAIELLDKFMEDFNKKFEKAKNIANNLDID